MFKHWQSFLVINLAFVVAVIELGFHHWSDENALLENLQAFLLVFATILYLRLTLPAHKSKESILGNMGLSLLCFSFLLREVDIEQLPRMETVGFLFHGAGRTGLILLLWCVLLKKVYDHGEVKLLVSELLASDYLHCLKISFLLLMVGVIFDREFWLIEHGRLYEELAETNAYLLLIIPAIYGCYYNTQREI